MLVGQELDSRCGTSGESKCPRQATCPVRAKMAALQSQMDEYMQGITLADLIQAQGDVGEAKTTVRRTK